jgi:hypothetical protein
MAAQWSLRSKSRTSEINGLDVPGPIRAFLKSGIDSEKGVGTANLIGGSCKKLKLRSSPLGYRRISPKPFTEAGCFARRVGSSIKEMERQTWQCALLVSWLMLRLTSDPEDMH